jgi:hypothetical protein
MTMSKRLHLIASSLTLICVQPLSAQPTEPAPTAEQKPDLSLQSVKQRTRLTEQALFYVDPVKGDDGNSCTSQEQPCKTVQAAYDKMYENYDFNGFDARMQLADGDYTDGLGIAGHLVGAVSVQVVGNCGDPQAVKVNPTEGRPAFAAQDGGNLQVACLQVGGSGAVGFQAGRMGVLQVNFQPGDTLVFGDMPGGTGIIATDGGTVNIFGSVVISGNAAVHWSVSSLSRLTVDGGTTYSFRDGYAIDYFLTTNLNSVVALGANVTFDGPDPTGQKYNVTSGARLSLNGNVLPGTIAGAVEEGQAF